MIDFDALEGQLKQLWVLPASGLADAAVYLSNQDMVSPAPGPCISIFLDGARKRGFDSVTSVYDASQPNGQEIQRTAAGHREVTVKLEAFSPDTVERPGAPSARALLSRVQDSLSLPGMRQALNAAGIGVIDEGGPVRYLPGIQKAAWEGRAFLDVRLRVVATATEALGYIATVNMTGTVKQASSDPNPATFNVQVKAP